MIMIKKTSPGGKERNALPATIRGGRKRNLTGGGSEKTYSKGKKIDRDSLTGGKKSFELITPVL